MCLNIHKGVIPQKAQKDIPVYKIVRKIKINKDVFKPQFHETNFKTLYINAHVSIGKTYKSRLIIEEYTDRSIINYGLHSFARLNDARKEAKHRINCKIVKCIIPKNSKFCLGEFGLEAYPSYASSQLKYVKALKYH